jgi:hypothetical protein
MAQTVSVLPADGAAPFEAVVLVVELPQALSIRTSAVPTVPTTMCLDVVNLSPHC